jgi:hypothetical protein
MGILAFAYQGITYTSKEKVLDLGPLEITSEKTKEVPLLPAFGTIALASGVILLIMSSTKKV